MRKIAWVCLIAAVLSWSIQDPEPKPTLSDSPLTAEQVAVYRTFLQKYLESPEQALNIANVTSPLDFSEFEMKEGKGCLRGIFLENFKQAHSVVHRVGSEVAINSKITIVDPKEQAAKIKEKDPSVVLQKGEKNVEAAVNDAFVAGLFRFSEIAFDKDHAWAVMTYSFHCGMLCGHGGPVVLHKVGGAWKVTDRECGSWIS